MVIIEPPQYHLLHWLNSSQLTSPFQLALKHPSEGGVRVIWFQVPSIGGDLGEVAYKNIKLPQYRMSGGISYLPLLKTAGAVCWRRGAIYNSPPCFCASVLKNLPSRGFWLRPIRASFFLFHHDGLRPSLTYLRPFRADEQFLPLSLMYWTVSKRGSNYLNTECLSATDIFPTQKLLAQF